MESVVHLSPTDILTERPFTHPDKISGDLDTLRFMAQQLSLTLQNPHMSVDLPQTILHNQAGKSSWIHRQVLAHPQHFQDVMVFYVVGFFGQRRPEADIALAREFDRTLMDEIPQHEGLSSYSTMLLSDGNYANLVLFTSEEAQLGWSRSQAHAKAVYDLSPNYYHAIRIYNGRIPNGISQSQALALYKARYFDYDQTPMWRGIRTLI